MEHTYNVRNKWRPYNNTRRPCGIPKRGTDAILSTPLWSFPTQAYSTTDSTNHWCTPLSRTTLKDSRTLPPPRLSLLGWQQQKTSAKEAEGGTFPASKRKASTPSSPSSVGSKAIRYLPSTASVHSGHASQSVQVPHFSNPSYR